jgi:hypothetical protein
MAKDLTDLGQRDTSGDHLTGGGVTKPVRADLGDLGPAACPAHGQGYPTTPKGPDRGDRT